MNDFKEWLSDYLRYFLLGFAILAVIVIAVVGIVIYKKIADPAPKTQLTDTARVEWESGGTEAETVSEGTSPETNTEKDTENVTEADKEPATEKTTEANSESENSSESEKESSESEEGTTETSGTGETEKDPEYLKVTTSLNLRSEPEGTVITTYEAGRIVKFLGKEGDWYKVRVGGQDGYMSSQYLEEVPYEAGMEDEVETNPATEPVVETEPIYKTLKGTCYLRADTSKDAQILGTYNAGATIQFLEDVGGWYRVQVDGMTGYMGAQFF